jgi:hypothetical protein
MTAFRQSTIGQTFSAKQDQRKLQEVEKRTFVWHKKILHEQELMMMCLRRLSAV